MLIVETATDSKSDHALGARLIEAGKLSRQDYERISQVNANDESLCTLLIRSGIVSEHDTITALAELLDTPLVSHKNFPEFAVLPELISTRFLKQHKVFPLSASDDELAVAMVDPGDGDTINALEFVSGRRICVSLGFPSEIDAAIEQLYGSGKTKMARIADDLEQTDEEELTSNEQIEQLRDLASEGPVIRLVNLLIEKAVECNASDIHIEPFENQLRLRYRVDGMLQEAEAPPQQLVAAIISRVKIMAKLDIAERRLPQDGRICLRVRGNSVDLRVSTLPTLHGEGVVMRLLYKDNTAQDFEELGFEPKTLKKFLSAVQRPHGIVLVTGPTGSGKTTTLYAALTTLNDPSRKIITVEDPIEYELPGVNQIQVKPQIGLTFAGSLRTIVRQDPDVIMIGEMRDTETAEIAVQSALTGHLVLSTLHTNDAAGSVTRMLDMGLQSYLVTSVLNGVLAQRLVRRLCPSCRKAYQPLPELIRETKLDTLADPQSIRLFKPVGCEHCHGSGYRGRSAIMEMLEVTESIRGLILNRADSRQIARAAIAEGMETLYLDGLRKALAGVTSIEEVMRVSREI